MQEPTRVRISVNDPEARPGSVRLPDPSETMVLAGGRSDNDRYAVLKVDDEGRVVLSDADIERIAKAVVGLLPHQDDRR